LPLLVLAVSHGEKSGVGLVLAALIPVIGLALVAGLIFYAVRKSR